MYELLANLQAAFERLTLAHHTLLDPGLNSRNNVVYGYASFPAKATRNLLRSACGEELRRLTAELTCADSWTMGPTRFTKLEVDRTVTLMQELCDWPDSAQSRGVQEFALIKVESGSVLGAFQRPYYSTDDLRLVSVATATYRDFPVIKIDQHFFYFILKPGVYRLGLMKTD